MIFSKFDIVNVSHSPVARLAVVLLGPLDIPIFDDYCASDAAMTPLDIQNPEEWEHTFKAYICLNLLTNDYFLADERYMVKYEGSVTEGSVPFDHGTGNLRLFLGLIKLAEKWYGKSSPGFLSKHLKKYRDD